MALIAAVLGAGLALYLAERPGAPHGDASGRAAPLVPPTQHRGDDLAPIERRRDRARRPGTEDEAPTSMIASNLDGGESIQVLFLRGAAGERALEVRTLTSSAIGVLSFERAAGAPLLAMSAERSAAYVTATERGSFKLEAPRWATIELDGESLADPSTIERVRCVRDWSAQDAALDSPFVAKIARSMIDPRTAPASVDATGADLRALDGWRATREIDLLQAIGFSLDGEGQREGEGTRRYSHIAPGAAVHVDLRRAPELHVQLRGDAGRRAIELETGLARGTVLDREPPGSARRPVDIRRHLICEPGKNLRIRLLAKGTVTGCVDSAIAHRTCRVALSVRLMRLQDDRPLRSTHVVEEQDLGPDETCFSFEVESGGDYFVSVRQHVDVRGAVSARETATSIAGAIAPLLIGQLVMLPLLIFYIWHAAARARFEGGAKRVLWALFLFFGAPFTMPIYWYLHVWRAGAPGARSA